ncbi:MAG TPA: hypothetical protein VII73_08780 [Caulobacteraceae bacterium]
MSTSRALIGVAAAVATLGLAATGASAYPHERDVGAAGRSCFYVSEWRGWKAPRPDVLYLGINQHEVYRVDLGGAGSYKLQSPGVHLISKVRTGVNICGPLDLDLSVADEHGMAEPLIATGLTRLSDADVAAIPPRYRP